LTRSIAADARTRSASTTGAGARSRPARRPGRCLAGCRSRVKRAPTYASGRSLPGRSSCQKEGRDLAVERRRGRSAFVS
jgi:hypothetical protein